MNVLDSTFLRTVLTDRALLAAHGAYNGRHRGSLWAVEPLLLEGQVSFFGVAV